MIYAYCLVLDDISCYEKTHCLIWFRLQNSRFRSFSLAVFTLAPDLSFEYGPHRRLPSLVFAQNTTVLQSRYGFTTVSANRVSPHNYQLFDMWPLFNQAGFLVITCLNAFLTHHINIGLGFQGSA